MTGEIDQRTRLEFYRSTSGYGWNVTLYVRGKHRVRWNSTKATTPMLWRFIRGGDENCNRALTFAAWPIGMLDVWWEPNWRPDGSGLCDECEREVAAMNNPPGNECGCPGSGTLAHVRGCHLHPEAAR